MAEAERLTVRELFARGRYVVPVYQRAYAWTADEISTLVRDVRDGRARDGSSRYYLGTLVVHSGRSRDDGTVLHEVVDGQQRLTTLFLWLTHHRVQRLLGGSQLQGSLVFEGRERSTHDLDQLARARVSGAPRETPREEDLLDDGIRLGVETLDALLAEDVLTGVGAVSDEDLKYLLDHVVIVRTSLPEGTDLNHYFEVMNSRGEQLEKHEVVKARLMSHLGGDRVVETAFGNIWDACADLERHVQAGLPKGVRGTVFGQDWDTFLPADAGALFADLTRIAGGVLPEPELLSLDTVLAAPEVSTVGKATEDDYERRYGVVIDFPNLLLHVLKIHRRDPFRWEATGAVALDDKRLIEQFEEWIDSFEKDDRANAVRELAWTLLKVRHLFDQYVIRTDKLKDNTPDDSNWVLHRVWRTGSPGRERLSPINTFGEKSQATDDEPEQASGQHLRVLMLQAMFQVTDSRRAYKNFLYGILEFLARRDDSSPIGAGEFIAHLEGMAEERSQRLLHGSSVGDASAVMDQGTRVPHFLFNWLDYLLWREKRVGGGARHAVTSRLSSRDVEDFRFRYRTSVEHFYPQHPDSAEGHHSLERSVLDSFGNLALMTRSENSRRSNLVPEAKIKQYASREQSLKFQAMAEMGKSGWGEEQIAIHGQECLTMLLGSES